MKNAEGDFKPQMSKYFDVGDFPLSIAMTDAGQYAFVTNLFDHDICILEVLGANTTVMTYTQINGDYPVDVEYNPVNACFYVTKESHLDISDWQNGIYFVRLIDDNFSKHGIFIKN